MPFHRRAMYEKGITVTPDRGLQKVEQCHGRLQATLVNELTRAEEQRIVDHVVIEMGTTPADELFGELKPSSRNGGLVDLEAFATGQEQKRMVNPAGAYELYRIGDAVACRDVHGAILDAMRVAAAL